VLRSYRVTGLTPHGWGLDKFESCRLHGSRLKVCNMLGKGFRDHTHTYARALVKGFRVCRLLNAVGCAL
jgi:hypothetical protein